MNPGHGARGSELRRSRLFGIEHEQDPEDDHQGRPDLFKETLPAAIDFGEAFGQGYATANDGETEMLGLDVLHHFHVMGAVHPGGVVMEKEHDGSDHAEDGKGPGGPEAFQFAAGPLQFDEAEEQQDEGEYFMLQIFGIVMDGEP